jgi:putative aldouronate transport system substrate-binding protein
MKTRILAMLMAALMALTLAACGGGGDTPAATATPLPLATPGPTSSGDQTQITEQKVTIKAMQWALDNQTTDFANLWYFQKLEEVTNVAVDWWVVKQADWQTQMNLMFVSMDYPDVILRPDASLNVEEYGVTQGVLLPLNDYIPSYMPNYYSRLGYNNVTDSMYSSDGNMYYIGYLIAQNINHNAHHFINSTWLSEVGLGVPTTVDQLTAVLRAFKNSGAGAAGAVPMSGGGGIDHQIEGVYNYFSMFGVPLQRYVYASITDDDKVVFPGYMDGFRPAVEWLAMCYKDGLLDMEALDQEENAWNAKINADQVGYATYLRLINSAWANPDTTQNWSSILPPSTGKAAVPRILEIPEFGAVLTVAASRNNKVEAILKWLDRQFDTEWMMVAANGPSANISGPIDPTIELVNGKWNVIYIPDNNGLYNYVPVTQGQFFAPGDYYFDIYELPPHRIERKDYAKEYEAAGVLEKNSYEILQKLVKPTSAQAEEISRLHAALETFMKESIADFIINGVTDAKFTTFLNNARNVGADRYAEIYQGLYDSYKASVN